MSMFRVTWRIDHDAETPYEAACKALAIQRDPASIATCFQVRDRSGSRKALHFDLSECDHEEVE